MYSGHTHQVQEARACAGGIRGLDWGWGLNPGSWVPLSGALGVCWWPLPLCAWLGDFFLPPELSSEVAWSRELHCPPPSRPPGGGQAPPPWLPGLLGIPASRRGNPRLQSLVCTRPPTL